MSDDADAFNLRELQAGRLTPSHVTTMTRAFQRSVGLDDDGKAGTKTRAALDPMGPLVLPAERVWPMRALADGRKPTITSAFRNPDRPHHSGVDVMFARLHTDPPMKVGDGGRTASWWVPENTQALAWADGYVSWAGSTPTGHRCWLDHPGALHTGYFHLRLLAVKPGDLVRAGQFLGIVSDNPVDFDPDHLHFEAARGSLDDLPRSRIDPAILLSGALYLPSA